MSTSTFLIALPIVILMLILLRVFWLELYIVTTVLQILGTITIVSLVSATVWCVVKDSTEGFYRCWLFFGIVYTVLVAMIAGIISDIFSMGLDFIRYIFRIK